MSMIEGDTRTGGPRRHFPSTCWSRFLGPAGARGGAVEELSKSYWKPIFAYIRAGWARSNEDAKDLTQDFFVWLMEGDFLARVDPARGRFRSFVKVALKHYLTDEVRKRRSLKRGGDAEVRSLSDPATADALPAESEKALDDAWVGELLTRARERLEATLKAEGNEATFAVFRDYYLAEAGKLIYRDVAARHGIGEADVLNRLKQAKRRFRAVLADLVAETVGTEGDLVDEMKALFGTPSP